MNNDIFQIGNFKAKTRKRNRGQGYEGRKEKKGTRAGEGERSRACVPEGGRIRNSPRKQRTN